MSDSQQIAPLQAIVLIEKNTSIYTQTLKTGSDFGRAKLARKCHNVSID
jgi:hypothetical protein